MTHSQEGGEARALPPLVRRSYGLATISAGLVGEESASGGIRVAVIIEDLPWRSGIQQ